jgi:hypothetical protein
MTDGSSISFNPPRGALTAKLTRPVDHFVALALAFGGFMVVLEVWYLVASHWPYDPEGFLIGRDFVNTWMGARIALTGDPTPWFDYKAYNAALQAAWGADYPHHLWSYPPHLLLLTWPFALIAYMPAFFLWSALGLAAYLLTATEGQWRWQTVLLLIMSPAVAMNMMIGQNGFFTAALLIGGLISLDRRPVLAGVLFGLLTVKPQLGVLLPLMLMLTGRWRTIVSAAVTAIVLVGLTCVVFGPGVWSAYRDVAMPYQTYVILQGFGVFVSMMPTVFMNARLVGLPLDLVWAAQGVVSVAAVAAVVWTYWQRRDPVLSLALLVTAAFVVTPYAFNYDMVIFSWVIAKLVDRPGNTGWDYGLMFAVWVLPVATIIVGLAGIPGSGLVLIAFGGRLLWRLRNDERLAGLSTHPPGSQPVPS